MSQDFNKGKIYKITNDYNDDIYVGSTCDTLIRRFINHKRSSKTEKKQNMSIYKLMNEIGFERFRIELIEDYQCQDRYQLRQREGHFIRQFGTLNQNIAGRTNPEWRENNKDKIKEHKKEYNEANKDKISEQCKEYYKANKDKIQEHKKEYNEANKDRISEQGKDYYKANKDEILENLKVKITCECGCIVNKSDIPRHKRTIKHQELMQINQTLI